MLKILLITAVLALAPNAVMAFDYGSGMPQPNPPIVCFPDGNGGVICR